MAARAVATPLPGTLTLLARYDRRESIAILSAALLSGKHISYEAGTALGLVSDPAAVNALREALKAPEPAVVAAALAGLRIRGDSATCRLVVPHLRASDAKIRSAAIRAAARLACIERRELREFAKSDPDPGVRSLAKALLKER